MIFSYFGNLKQASGLAGPYRVRVGSLNIREEAPFSSRSVAGTIPTPSVVTPSRDAGLYPRVLSVSRVMKSKSDPVSEWAIITRCCFTMTAVLLQSVALP